MRSLLLLAIFLISCGLIIDNVDARLPRKSSTPTTEASLEADQSSPEKDNSPETAEENSNSPSETGDEQQFPRRHANPFSLLERILDLHLREMNRNPMISIRPMNPNYNPFGFYPEPVVVRRPSILSNRFPFPNNDPFDFSGFPSISNFPSLARPGGFDVDSDKVPEGYVKVNETIEGPEGHQVIHTTYEKKDTEGPNQFYGIIVKIRPYKQNKESEGKQPENKKPEASIGDSKKQDDRRVASESKPNAEREVEESAAKPIEKEKPQEDKTEKPDTEPIESNKEKSSSENEIPKFDETPSITVNDNNKA